jgi:hypothetical protein
MMLNFKSCKFGRHERYWHLDSEHAASFKGLRSSEAQF